MRTQSVKTKSYWSAINHIASAVEIPINISDRQIKKRKLRSKLIWISDLSNVISGVNTTNKLTKKMGEKDDMYTLNKHDHKETEEAKHESERILNSS